VTVTNCVAPLTVTGVPRRVITNDTGITELMFALGLRDRPVGYTSYPGKERDVATSPLPISRTSETSSEYVNVRTNWSTTIGHRCAR
jgi:hypothetical protein